MENCSHAPGGYCKRSSTPAAGSSPKMGQLLKRGLTGNSLLETGGMQRGVRWMLSSGWLPLRKRGGAPSSSLKISSKNRQRHRFLRSQKGDCIFKNIPEFSVTPCINEGYNHQRIYHTREYQEKIAVWTPHGRMVIMH